LSNEEPTGDELRAAFELALAEVIAGQGVAGRDRLR
jgi:hypothetical protein